MCEASSVECRAAHVRDEVASETGGPTAYPSVCSGEVIACAEAYHGVYGGAERDALANALTSTVENMYNYGAARMTCPDRMRG